MLQFNLYYLFHAYVVRMSFFNFTLHKLIFLVNIFFFCLLLKCSLITFYCFVVKLFVLTCILDFSNILVHISVEFQLSIVGCGPSE